MKTLDLRQVQPKERHSLFFKAFDELSTGDSIELINDHEPAPLYYQLKAEHEGEFVWNVQSGDSDEWVVSIQRTSNPVTVRDIVNKYPASIPLLNDLQIDYCCHGHESFSTACRQAKVSSEGLLEQIKNIPQTKPQWNVDHWSFTMICDFIVMNHHEFIRSKGPEIIGLSEKVSQVHGNMHPELYKIHSTFTEMNQELLTHMKKEEEELFPVIKELDQLKGEINTSVVERINDLIDQLEQEHDQAGSVMKELRKISRNFTPPADACFSYELLLKELKGFEEDLFAHVHMENNVLFPKVMALES